jgi:hypothetical protein
MKKNLIAVAFSLFVVLMVLPVTGSVNNTPGKLFAPHTALLADGNPIPPMPPYGITSVSFVAADGNPIPPMPPYGKTSSSLIAADGNPIPPMPPYSRTSQAVA